MNTTSAVLLEAAGLGPGGKGRIICPTCGGGRTKERSLSISVDEAGTARWHCFRAACPESGTRSQGRLVRTRHTPHEQTARPYRGELQPLDEAWEEFLAEKIGWTQQHIAMARPRYAVEDGRVAMPIYGPTGARRGWALRSYSGAEPKALTRMDVPEPHMSYYRFHGPEDLVLVVEDIPSAVRAGMYVNAVSLCGTGAGPDYVNEIAEHYRRVVWALDADALGLAVERHRENALMFDESSVCVLDKDIKDMAEDEVAALLGEYV